MKASFRALVPALTLVLAMAPVSAGAAATATSGSSRASVATAPSGRAALTQPSITVPSNFRRHEMRHWTWYGPRDWTAAEGANDVWITSPTGSLYLHYGASAAPCAAPGMYRDPGTFFAFVRRSYLSATRQNFNFYSYGLASARYTRVAPIQRISPTYVRQAAAFTGLRPSGRRINGEMILDFFYVGAGVCGTRQQVRSAPTTGYTTSIAVLRKVQQFIFGPR